MAVKKVLILLFLFFAAGDGQRSYKDHLRRLAAQSVTTTTTTTSTTTPAPSTVGVDSTVSEAPTHGSEKLGGALGSTPATDPFTGSVEYSKPASGTTPVKTITGRVT